MKSNGLVGNRGTGEFVLRRRQRKIENFALESSDVTSVKNKPWMLLKDM